MVEISGLKWISLRFPDHQFSKFHLQINNLQEIYWCGWRGSNPRPLASEANTLSTELQPQLKQA